LIGCALTVGLQFVSEAEH